MLSQSIISLDRIKSQILETLTQDTPQNTLNNNERKEYSIFLNFLQGRIHSECNKLYLKDHKAPPSLPCPNWTEALSGNDEQKATTPAEQISKLDLALSQSLGEFDELLLKEQEKAALRIPAGREPSSTQSTGNMSESAASTTEEPPGTGHESSSKQEGEQSTHNQSSTSNTNRIGTQQPAPSDEEQDTNQSQTAGQKRFAPKDDDIIARQLREAAEKETEPELKEKLWDEYRKYREKSY